MPIYRCKVRGENKPRIVRADTAAQARNHIVEAETMTAEEMADAIEQGATVERAGTETPSGDDDKGKE